MQIPAQQNMWQNSLAKYRQFEMSCPLTLTDVQRDIITTRCTRSGSRPNAGHSIALLAVEVRATQAKTQSKSPRLRLRSEVKCYCFYSRAKGRSQNSAPGGELGKPFLHGNERQGKLQWRSHSPSTTWPRTNKPSMFSQCHLVVYCANRCRPQQKRPYSRSSQ